MSMSNYLEEAILNAVFRNVAFTSPATTYLALYTSDPTEADTGTEVTGGAYVRRAVTFSAPTQVANKATISNSAEIQFPEATAAWGTVTHVGLRSALTAGNLLYYGPVSNARSILANDQLRFKIGELILDLD